jgi:GxxExxY protein
MEFDDLTNKVIGLAIEVHRELGPGLLESTYQKCLRYEMDNAGINYIPEKQIPVMYKGKPIDAVYRIDFLVENTLVVELKSLEEILSVHEAQILTYMKLSKMRLGLLINFNVKLLKHGIKRFIL